MGSVGVQIVCVGLGVLGLIGAIVCCTVPRWKVSSFIGSNIVTAQSRQDGLWMSCVVQSTGQQQCKSYDSILVLASDLQAARAMIIISCMVSCFSILILFCGADFTTFIENEDTKPKITLVSGVGLLVAGLLVIIPVSWSANTIVQNFNNPNSPDKMELGECIFVGWGASALLLLAGGLLCCFSRPKSGSSGGVARFTNSNPATNKAFV
ncbi:Claudin-4 Clostridium perfringens enterotoxin receptor [Channa argus]|uniref:Claudin n=1 Tax=Channa argus TaxID=215402 RepID=A0A6G1QCG9_CHAAH|nr:Claudin-4 Clostridium perfringens enterotoxin receptor [Channa argus]KAK2893492.1 hypothetical protein Q8A73_015976 [Channa argus]